MVVVQQASQLLVPTTSSEVELMETLVTGYGTGRRVIPNNFFGSRINGNSESRIVLVFACEPNNFFGSRINGNTSYSSPSMSCLMPNNFFGSRINGNHVEAFSRIKSRAPTTSSEVELMETLLTGFFPKWSVAQQLLRKSN